MLCASKSAILEAQRSRRLLGARSPFDMTTFCLDPIPDMKSSHHWRASMIPPIAVWVVAENEKDARQKVTLATIIATRVDRSQEMPIEPWKDFGLVKCSIR